MKNFTLTLLGFISIFSLSGCGATGKLLGTLTRLPIDIARGGLAMDNNDDGLASITNEGQSLNHTQ